MKNRQAMKKMFDDEFNIEKMKKQILLKNETNSTKYTRKSLKYIVPVFLLVMIATVSIAIKNGSTLQERLRDEKPKTSSSEVQKDSKIHVNSLENVGLAKIDADIKEIAIKGADTDFLDTLHLPKDLKESSAYGIYTRSDKTEDYNILNSYVYTYSNTASNREVWLAFSKTNKPVRDYLFEDFGKVSKISGVELKVYQYLESYIVEFFYQKYYFDIETHQIKLEELVTLLESIIKS